MKLVEKCRWRRRWDSNPRYAFTYAGFQDRCIRPLCHSSGGSFMRLTIEQRKVPAKSCLSDKGRLSMGPHRRYHAPRQIKGPRTGRRGKGQIYAVIHHETLFGRSVCPRVSRRLSRRAVSKCTACTSRPTYCRRSGLSDSVRHDRARRRGARRILRE